MATESNEGGGLERLVAVTVCVVALIVPLGVLGLAAIIRSCEVDQDVEKTTRMKLEQHLKCTYSDESRQMLCYPADE